MEFAVHGDLLQDFPAVGLEAGVEVVQPDVREGSRHPVEDPGRQSTAPRVTPGALPARDEVERAVFERLQQARNLVGIVLEVTIHRDENSAPRVIHAGREGRRLAEVPAQPDEPHPGITLVLAANGIGGAVGRAVVDEHEFRPDMNGVQVRKHALREGGNRRTLVEDRHEDADVEARFLVPGDGRLLSPGMGFPRRRRQLDRLGHRLSPSSGSAYSNRPLSTWTEEGACGLSPSAPWRARSARTSPGAAAVAAPFRVEVERTRFSDR